MLIKIRGRYIVLFITILLIIVFILPRCLDSKPKISKNTDSPAPTNSKEKINVRAASTGDNILIHQVPWLNENKEIHKKCIQNWQLKLDFEFDRYLQECPIDIEAKIYSNNQKAKKNAAILTNSIILNIAIVVPISGNKEELRNELDISLEQEPQFNGTRVFDSIEILKGIELAQRENFNGIQLGDKKVFLKVLIVDDSYVDNISDEQKAQTAANFLVENQNTVAVIGHFSSDSIQAAASIYNNKLVAFSPTSTAIRTDNELTSSSDNLDKLKLNSYIFRTSPNDTVAIDTLIDAIENINKNSNNSLNSAIILYEEEDVFSKLYKQYFENKFLEKIDNSKIVDVQNSPSCRFYNNKSNHQKEYCIKAIKDNKPDLLLLVPSSKRALDIAGTVLKGINDFESKPQLLGADSMFDQFFLSDFAEGMIVAVPVKTLIINNIQLSWRGAMTYDATKAIVQGIQNSECNIDINDNGSNGKINECLRQQIQKVLSDENFNADGILGKNTVFFENGDREIDEALERELEEPLQVKKSEAGQYSFELY